MPTGLQVFARHEEWVQIIELVGEITKSDGLLPDQLLPRDEETKALIFNFSGVEYINSAGISLLIRIVRQAKEQSVAVLSFGLNEHYQKIFKMVGLTSYLYVYPNETAAFAAAGLIR